MSALQEPHWSAVPAVLTQKTGRTMETSAASRYETRFNPNEQMSFLNLWVGPHVRLSTMTNGSSYLSVVTRTVGGRGQTVGSSRQTHWSIFHFKGLIFLRLFIENCWFSLLSLCPPRQPQPPPSSISVTILSSSVSYFCHSGELVLWNISSNPPAQ